MRLTATTATVACHAAVTAALSTGSHAFVIPRGSAVPATEGRGRALDSTEARVELEALLVDLRGGKKVGLKKSGGSKSKGDKKSVKGSKVTKGVKKTKSSKPSFMATIKAFFISLVNPHFALKLQANHKNQVHTVHGSASTTGASS